LLDIELARIPVPVMPRKVLRMNIFLTILFLLPLMLVTRYLYVSGVFTNRRAFQFTFYVLLTFFALIIGIGGLKLSYQGYDLPTTAPLSLSEVLPEP